MLCIEKGIIYPITASDISVEGVIRVRGGPMSYERLRHRSHFGLISVVLARTYQPQLSGASCSPMHDNDKVNIYIAPFPNVFSGHV